MLKTFFGKNKVSFVWTIMLLLFLFPPVPRMYFSKIFKLEFLVLICLFFYLFLNIFKKHNEKRIKVETFEFVWLLFVMLGVGVGVINKNLLYPILKDVVYLLTPVIVFFLLDNFDVLKRKEFVNAVFVYGGLISILQIMLSFYAFFKGVDRPVFRHVFLLFSTEMLPVLTVLRFVRVRKLRDFYIVLYLFTLVLTRGRADLLFVGLFLTFWLISEFIKKPKTRLAILFLLMLSFSVVWITPLLFEKIFEFFDSSLKWRYREWFAFFDAAKNFGLREFIFGQGLGSQMISPRPLKVFGGSLHVTLQRFHNGFLFLIYKTGIIGMVCYMCLSFLAFKQIEKLKENSFFIILFMVAFLLYIYFPVHGGFTMSISQGIILGLILYFSVKTDDCKVF